MCEIIPNRLHIYPQSITSNSCLLCRRKGHLAAALLLHNEANSGIHLLLKAIGERVGGHTGEGVPLVCMRLQASGHLAPPPHGSSVLLSLSLSLCSLHESFLLIRGCTFVIKPMHDLSKGAG